MSYRYPIYIGGNQSTLSTFVAKLPNSQLAVDNSGIVLTAPTSDSRRRPFPTKGQSKAEREALQARNLLRPEDEVEVLPDISDRWRLTYNQRSYNGVNEQLMDGQDIRMVMYFDAERKCFHLMRPSFLHFTPEATFSRFKTVDEAEAFQKKTTKQKKPVEKDDEDDNSKFDFSKIFLHSQNSDSKPSKRKKAKAIEESWEWQKEDDDEGICEENIDDLEMSDDDGYRKDKKVMSDKERLTKKLLKSRGLYVDDEDDDDDDPFKNQESDDGEPGEVDGGDDDDDSDDSDEMEEGAKKRQEKRTRENEVVDDSQRKRARLESSTDASQSTSPILSLTVDDVYFLFQKKAGSSDFRNVSITKLDIFSLFPPNYPMTGPEKVHIFSLINQTCSKASDDTYRLK